MRGGFSRPYDASSYDENVVSNLRLVHVAVLRRPTIEDCKSAKDLTD